MFMRIGAAHMELVAFHQMDQLLTGSGDVLM